MTDDKELRPIRSLIGQFRTSDHWAVSLARDILWLMVVVGGIALALYLICGTWPAVVTIESESMVPNMNVGDLVVVVEKDRYGVFETWTDGNRAGTIKFGNYGDVIIYKPNGMTNIHPIIHRAIQYVESGPVVDLQGKKLPVNYTAPHEGYVTRGDHNRYPDQFSSYPGIGGIEPVREQWIIGKALFAVPVIGYLPLHIVEVTVIIFILMGVHELYLRSRENNKKTSQNKVKKKKR
jgi:signal peptidase